MIRTVFPSRLRGRVTAPPSKSSAHRLLIAASQCAEETVIENVGCGRDVEQTMECLREFGSQITVEAGRASVLGGLHASPAELYCRESGSTLRLLLPLAAVRCGKTTLDGSGRLPERPIGPLLETLRNNGAVISGRSLPLCVAGGLRSGSFILPGDVSSQFFSGLLMALPLLEKDSTLRCLSPLQSAGYVEMTRMILEKFGIRSEPLSDGWLVPGGQRYVSPGRVVNEGDWSAAAFFLTANALGAQIRVDGLDDRSCQPDRRIGDRLARIGGDLDVSECPDLMPVLSVAAALSAGRRTRFVGARRLREKESDRLSAMANALSALGGEVRQTPDGLIVDGGRLTGGCVDGCGDHRVVMSAAIGACFAEGPVEIRGAEAVEKSYPAFWRDLCALGGRAE